MAGPSLFGKIGNLGTEVRGAAQVAAKAAAKGGKGKAKPKPKAKPLAEPITAPNVVNLPGSYPVTLPGRRSRGILATDNYGRQILLPGPTMPDGGMANGRPTYSRFYPQGGIVDVSRRSPNLNSAATGASAIGAGSAAASKAMGQVPPPLPKELRGVSRMDPLSAEAMKLRRDLAAAAEQRQSGDSDALMHWLGNTYSNTFQSAVGVIHDMPAAMFMLGKQFGLPLAKMFVPGAANALAEPGESAPLTQVKAARDFGASAYNLGEETVKYDIQLQKELVNDPIGTIHNRSFDLGIAAAGAVSGIGATAGAALRASAAASRLASASRRAGSAAGGLRVMRGEKAAARRPGPIIESTYTYKNAAERRALAEKAAEITGNHIGGSVYDFLQRLGDKSTKSILPGSPRYRDPREIAPPTKDARGGPIGVPKKADGSPGEAPTLTVPRGPRSSNPVTRIIQQHIVEPVTTRFDAANQAQNLRGRIPYMASSYTAAAERRARAAGYSAQEATDQVVLEETQFIGSTSKQLSAHGRKNGLVSSDLETASAAAALHSMGATEPFQGSHTWGRDNLVTRMQNTLDGGNISRRERKGIEQQMQVLKDIPDAWLGQHPPPEVVKMGLANKVAPPGIPKLVQDLTAEHRRIYALSSEIQHGMGAINYQTAQWSKRRTQAQLIGGTMVNEAGLAGRTAHAATSTGALEVRGARPLSRVRQEAMAPVLADRRRAATIATEITARTKPWKKVPRNSALAGYSTDALRTMQQAYERRSRTIRQRVVPRLKVAEQNALEGNVLISEAARRADEARQRVRELSTRRTGEQYDPLIEQARAAREQATMGAKFDRNRAGARKKMASQGDIAMRRAAQGRLRRKHAAELAAAKAEVVKAEARHSFEVKRARARADNAVRGSQIMNDARARRARVNEAATRRDAAVKDAAKSKATFNTGVRKGKATERLNRTPESTTPGVIPGSRTRAYGTALRADGRLYVVGQRSGAAILRGKDTVSTVTRRAGEAAGGRNVLSPKARAAVAERHALRGESRGVSREAKPAHEALAATQRRHAREAAKVKNTPPSRATRSHGAEQQAMRGELRGTPKQVRPARDRHKALQAARRVERAQPQGSLAQIKTAEVNARAARKDYAAVRRHEAANAYVDANLPKTFGMKPGEYFPHRPVRASRPPAPWHAMDGNTTGGKGGAARAAMAPAELARNEGKLIEQGNISLAPNLPSATLRQAVDAQQRTRVASAIIEEMAVKDINGTAITGKDAASMAETSGGVLTLVTKRQLARISSLASDTPEGQRLVAMMDEATNRLSKVDGDSQYLVPTGVIEGWTHALGPAGAGGRTIDYLNSLWKGGVLALSPRWYVQNMLGMWGQFALGAGADLQAIAMAKEASFTRLIPGRISASGLADDMGEYAKRLQGYNTNWVGGVIRGGFAINATFEAVPRRAMFWSASKRQLKDSDLIGNGPVQNAHVAQAWLDVAKAAAKGDPGANAILDQTVRVTERFMGNYSRYNQLEKNLLRRIFPFYAWMRSIHRLAFALPVKHPKRTAIIVVASQMANELYGLDSRELYGPRVAGGFVGGRIVGTGTMMPFESVVPSLQTQIDVGNQVAASQSVVGGVLSYFGGEVGTVFKAAIQQAGPQVGIPYTNVAGETPSGIPVRYRPGYQGAYPTYSGRDISVDTRTGDVRYGNPVIPVWEQAAQSFSQVNNFRKWAAGGTPYASSSTFDLAKYAASGRPDADAGSLVVNDPKYPRTTSTDALSLLSNILIGVSLDKYDPRAALIQQKLNVKNATNAWKAGDKTIKKGNFQAAAKKKG